MKFDRLSGAMLLVLGAGMILTALLGPLGFGLVRYHLSAGMESQMIGGEAVSLLLAGPLALLAGLLWLRDNPVAPALGIGPAAFATYTYVQFVLAPEYDRYPGNSEAIFPLLLVLILIGWVLAAGCWGRLRQQDLAWPSNAVRRLLAGVLLLLGVFFGLAWAAGIAGVITGSGITQEYREHPTAFWLVRLMDLGFLVPVGIATGVALLRRSALALPAGVAVAAFQSLMTASVAGMAIMMKVRNAPGASPVFLAITATIAVVLLTLCYLLIRSCAPKPIMA